ncbi:MAG: hypothetical protein JWL72_3845 [Ilumatobacteraceae bacterium]|nr:hypothetical protein [Ilumatobacteraceae bacterium]MCU1390507.1 hypothetical protein [Ilumatobacteraceae bacterium]
MHVGVDWPARVMVITNRGPALARDVTLLDLNSPSVIVGGPFSGDTMRPDRPRHVKLSIDLTTEYPLRFGLAWRDDRPDRHDEDVIYSP